MGRNNIVRTDGSIDYTYLGGMDDNITSHADKIGILSGELETVNAQLEDIAINVCSPKFGLEPVKADGTDILGDTNRLQEIMDYAIANAKDVYIPKDLILQPILQTDGSLVCIKLNDGATNGNIRKPIKIYGKKGIAISTNNTTQKHTIFRWKLGDSVLDGVIFKGTRAYTTGLEISRINLTDTTEFDGATRNKFTNLRFVSCNIAMSLEGSAYYNTFETISAYSCNKVLWLKVTYAMENRINNKIDSNVNRNNFYNISAYSCTDGIILDYGDTNKFYSCSFEGLSGTSVQVNEQSGAYSGAWHTVYNTFYGITNEANGMNLILNSSYGNSFIDFEGALNLVQLNAKPLVYIPSGDSGNNHMILQYITQMNDKSELGYVGNKTYMQQPVYVNNISDYDISTFGSDGLAKGYDWRSYKFTTTDCVNVATLSYNTASGSFYKSIGKIVHYVVKLSFTATTTTSTVKFPLPPNLKPDSLAYSYGGNGPLGQPVTVQVDSSFYVTATRYDVTNNLIEIMLPAGVTNWGASNTLLIDISYGRNITVTQSN